MSCQQAMPMCVGLRPADQSLDAGLDGAFSLCWSGAVLIRSLESRWIWKQRFTAFRALSFPGGRNTAARCNHGFCEECSVPPGEWRHSMLPFARPKKSHCVCSGSFMLCSEFSVHGGKHELHGGLDVGV